MADTPRPSTRLRASADLEYPFTAPASDGSAVEVAPGIVWLRMPMPLSLDHINVYLLHDGDGWVLVDTGLNTSRTRELWQQVMRDQLGGLPIKRLICTHNHYDHAGLASWFFEEHNVPVTMTHGEFFMMRTLKDLPPDPLPRSEIQFYLRAGMKEADIHEMFASLRRDPFMPPTLSSYVRMREGDVLTIGGRQWKIIIGEGHSPEHACLYSLTDHILLAGDQLLPRITSNVMVTPIEPEANPLQLWLASLDRLDQLAEDTLVLPSHQSVFKGLHKRVAEFRAHHQQQFDMLRNHLADHGPCTAQELMRVQFPRLRHTADMMMAMGETIAHLSWLRHAGSVRRVLDEDGHDRFSLAP